MDSFLKTGDEYKASLRDGRRVIYRGEEVDDVTQHPVFARAIDNWADLFDAQFDDETRDLTTFVDENSGERKSVGWLVPRTPEDLLRRRMMSDFSTDRTMGIFGRPPDYGPSFCMGFLARLSAIESSEPGAGEKINRFIEYASRENFTSADLVTEPQADRSLPPGQNPGRLRCVEERPDGVVLYGAKPVASAAVQSHIVTIGTLLAPGTDPSSALWAACPVNQPGVTLVTREPTVLHDTDKDDHPLNVHGEEPDAFMIFDHVFLPWEHVFSFKNLDTLKLYIPCGAIALWHILSRLARRAEIFAATAKMIITILGTEGVPAVRAGAADVMAYAATLNAFVLAAEARSTITESGVCVPDAAMVTAGRLHSIAHYPAVMQTLRDLSGQGLISRFTREDLERQDIAALLEEFLPGHGFSAAEKNRFFNFVWDLTCSSHAARVALFENTNATPPPTVRQQLYQAYDADRATALIKGYIDLEPASAVVG